MSVLTSAMLWWTFPYENPKNWNYYNHYHSSEMHFIQEIKQQTFQNKYVKLSYSSPTPEGFRHFGILKVMESDGWKYEYLKTFLTIPSFLELNGYHVEVAPGVCNNSHFEIQSNAFWSTVSNTRDSVSSGYPNKKRVENTTQNSAVLTKIEVFG